MGSWLCSHPIHIVSISCLLLVSSGEPSGAGRAGLQFWKPAAPSLLLSTCRTPGQLVEWGQPGVSGCVATHQGTPAVGPV